ncbi:Hypothetical predicted protein [Mytilus galloprovincialis]|uniref:Tc1-like transposase DDE domain-containing protein n=1 Tax=Mytilus galloprovincialis TaxID=29158 RepID=A0A8B6BNA5_MYTGA|nr:Hypothetical predicted protein [Mytilus galloprovincialis]
MPKVKLSHSHRLEIASLYRQNWKISAIVRYLSNQHGIDVNWSTVRNIILKYKSGDLFADPNSDFIKFRKVTDGDIFNNIIFTDECTVQLHDNKVVIYRLRDQVAQPIPQPKHPFKLHVWGGISRRGTTRLLIFDGILRSDFFVDKILRQTLLPFIQDVYPDKHRFQQDNDPKHRSILSKNFMKSNNINWWECWPSESPDLNPIEMVWNMLKRRLAKKDLKTKEDLETALEDFWTTDLTVECCNRFIDHLYKVVPTVMIVQGRATADLPRKIFPERSLGKSIDYFNSKLKEPLLRQKIANLLPN